MTVEEGTLVTAERTFTEADVRDFTEVSGDRGDHHLERDDDGRLLVHGLLTATLATEIGGRYTVLARTMEYHFHEPVYAGELIRCEAEFTTVTERTDGRTEVEADLTFTRPATEDDGDADDGGGETVLTGRFDGVVP